MIKISHETPLCLLKESLNFNSYQYSLPHLLESNEEYRNHFIKCKELGIEIYLDNSLHELGSAMSDDILLKWIEILEPSNFFIPDVWENFNQSIINAKKWSNIDLPKNVTKVPVIQANLLHEANISYNIYRDLGYEKIAFTYGSSYYNKIFNHPNKSLNSALGRVSVINSLYNNKIIQNSHRVHLLGTFSPFEFALLKDYKFIESIDTSNPIMAAIEGTQYPPTCIIDKPKVNMNEVFFIEKDKINMTLLNHNIKTFKKLLI